MDIAEIRYEVAICLHLQEWVVCCRVSKLWQETFIPLVYKVINISSFPFRNKDRWPSVEVVRRYGHHIRKLSLDVQTYDPDIVLEVATKVDRLHRLNPFCKVGTHEENFLQGQVSLKTLLHRNWNTVQELGFMYFSGPSGSKTVCQIAQLCPRLQKLDVVRSTFSFADMVYLEGCHELSELKFFNACHITTSGDRGGRDPLQLPSFPNLCLLGIEGYARKFTFFLDLVRCWPQLGSIQLSADSPGDDTNDESDDGDEEEEEEEVEEEEEEVEEEEEEVEEEEEAATYDMSPFANCSRLKKLDIDVELKDGNLSELLIHCHHLDTLRLAHQRVGKRSLEALLSLCGSLTTLDLSKGNNLKYWMLQRVLSNCSKLIHLSFSTLDAETDFAVAKQQQTATAELISSTSPLSSTTTDAVGRWACKGLETLKVRKLIWSLTAARNKGVMEQLAVFKKLVAIMIESAREDEESETTGYPGNHWKNGRFCRSQLVDDPDLEWMPITWPNLQMYRRGESI
ncbi:hypothetical protein BGZ83_010716 [Gryganskiella cystojenkinii]|nr:hypothetical protein BGZ83_010716 [Gryganskiella cystojenkinii]